MCLVARSNFQGIVKRLRIELINAAKYLSKIRYGFNDQGKLDNHIDRNI